MTGKSRKIKPDCFLFLVFACILYLSSSNQKKNPKKNHNNRPPKKKKVKSEKEDVSEGDAQSEPIVASAGDGEVGG